MFREGFGAEEDHEGGQVETVFFGASDEAREGVGGVDDVGVGEPEVSGRVFSCDVENAGVQGGEFAGPAGLERRRVENCYSIVVFGFV